MSPVGRGPEDPTFARQGQRLVSAQDVDFRFDVKAYSLLTGHPTRAASLWKDLHDGVRPEHSDQERIYATHLEPEALELAYVCIDAPPVSGLARVVAVTHEPAVLRCHGRSDGDWTRTTGSAAERFRYLYETTNSRSWRAPRGSSPSRRTRPTC